MQMWDEMDLAFTCQPNSIHKYSGNVPGEFCLGPAGKKPRTSHNPSLGGQRYRNHQSLMICTGKMRQEPCQLDNEGTAFKGKIEETSERWSGVHKGFPEGLDTIWT